MRLLNTQTLEFEEFFDVQIPEYAILSHRWGEKEVSFKEMRKGKPPPGPGILKIQRFCRKAAEHGFEWVWADICCIDKRSSAELSEAINSMFKWYESAKICYVHLKDVEITSRDLHLREQYGDGRWGEEFWPELRSKFCKSAWFTRGWTLQELLAPRRILFYDSRWELIGEMSDEQLWKDVFKACGIKSDTWDTDYLLEVPSVAQKMSWASRRQTSRSEDMAYCLMGLFGVNMPLLYGEGAHKAFYRLQLEIMKYTSDESLFAWHCNETWPGGMLASSPNEFRDSGDIVCNSLYCRSFSMTNLGIGFAVPEKHCIRHDSNHKCLNVDCGVCGVRNPLTRIPFRGQCIVFLNCYREQRSDLPLQISIGSGRNSWYRKQDHPLDQTDFPSPYLQICDFSTLKKNFKENAGSNDGCSCLCLGEAFWIWFKYWV